MGSERLPGKTLMPLHGKPVLEWVINSAYQIEGPENVIVATSDLPEDQPIADLAGHLGASVYHGDADNVLARFHGASLGYDAEHIIRVCADSPLLATDYISDMLKQHIDEKADLTCNGSQPFPLGPVAEIFTMEALHTAYREAEQPHQKVHVTPFILERPERFKILRTEAPAELRMEARLTIDEDHDLNMFASLFGAAEAEGVEINLKNCLRLLYERPDIKEINKNVHQRAWHEL